MQKNAVKRRVFRPHDEGRDSSIDGMRNKQSDVSVCHCMMDEESCLHQHINDLDAGCNSISASHEAS